LAHCSKVIGETNFHLWGLEQEFFGSFRFVLESLARTAGDQATLILKRMLDEDQQACLRMLASGKVSDAYMLAAPEEEIKT